MSIEKAWYNSMKTKKLFIINCIIPILLLSIYKLSQYILSILNLAFMNNTIYIFSIIFFIVLVPFLLQVTIALYNISKKEAAKLSIRYTSVVGAIVIAFVICISYIFGYAFFGFTYKPEHVVERDGKKMVAYVSNFLDVEVNYYEYINKFVRGNNVKINEYYGSGGYDPFEIDKIPTVHTYEYFDDNCNIIKSNEK